MDSRRKHCPVCAASNDADALYCKRCGSPLHAPVQSGDDRGRTAASTVKKFEGVSVEEAAIFVGRNADHYIPKFAEMEMRRSRASWNWPVLLLAVLCGPAALAVWFFYRKMNRPAFAFLAVGLAILIANTIISYQFNVQFYSLLMENIHELMARRIEAQEFMHFLLTASPAAANGSVPYVFNTMLSVLVFAGKLAVAVFANGIYKRHTAKCILAVPAGAGRSEVLRTRGGVNPGCAIGVAVGVGLAFLLAGAAPLLGALGIFPV